MRVTIKDVAREARVSHGTVSRAFSGKGRVAPATRDRIQRIADELGYRPDPVMGRLAEYRRRDGKRSMTDSVVALVTGGPTKVAWRASFNHLTWAEGIRTEADRLGYRLEVVWMPETTEAERQLSQQLFHRGIEGLLLLPREKEEAIHGLPWERFAAVSLATNFTSPQGLHVSHDRFENVRIAWEQLAALGYRRIGFCIEASGNARSRGLMLAAHLLEERLRAEDIIPLASLFDTELTREIFLKWVSATQPDAILTPHLNLLSWLRESGRRVPQDIGYAHLNSPHQDPGISGIDNQGLKVGASAMRALHRLLVTGQKGMPDPPQSILHPGIWKPGKTVRSKP